MKGYTHITIDRLGRKRTFHSKVVVFYFQCTVCHQPLCEASYEFPVGTVADHFCRACDKETPHKVVKTVQRKH